MLNKNLDHMNKEKGHSEEERNKLWRLQIELNNQFEEKRRKIILYLVDKIDWPTFYDQLMGNPRYVE